MKEMKKIISVFLTLLMLFTMAVPAFAAEGETIVSLVDIDSSEYRRKTDMKTVRRNVALPSWLNYEAEKAQINVSRVLQEALMATLGVRKK